MSTPQSYEFRHVNFDREMERLRGQLMLSWQKEAQQLVEFGLHDGMSILEEWFRSSHRTTIAYVSR